MNTPVTAGLLRWYDPYRRPLPWKNTRDPYLIWLSEVILQQTRVQQGMPYYLRFAERFPEVASLAAAPLDDILKLWEGLGYYTRARNLHAAARQVMKEHGGVFPSDYQSLLRLKGVGAYTAAAVASFASGEPVAVLDGNVFRVLSRVYGISEPIDTARGRAVFRQLAETLLDRDAPGVFNQAIMDFGALVCKPVHPACEDCPLYRDCAARREGRAELLPVKSKRIRRRHRYFDYYVITDGRRVLLEQRGSRDIWKGLYQFPLVESGPSFRRASPHPAEGEKWRGPAVATHTGNVRSGLKQVLTHQVIHARFHEWTVPDLDMPWRENTWQPVDLGSISSLAFPGVIRRYFERFPRFLQENGQL